MYEGNRIDRPDADSEFDLMFDNFPSGKKLQVIFAASLTGWLILALIGFAAWALFHG